MKISILEHLVCPSCRSELKLKTKKRTKNEINEGTLICTKCNDKFKISKDDFSVHIKNKKIKFDIAFIIVHGSPGEDGLLQSYFDLIVISEYENRRRGDGKWFGNIIKKEVL